MGPVALQLYTVRGALAEDTSATLRRVRAAGYTAVEAAPLPPGLTAPALGGLLRPLGLKVVALHCELPLAVGQAGIFEAAAQLGCDRVIWHGWPRHPGYDWVEGIRGLAASCNQAGAAARDHGLRFALHNHWWEYESTPGPHPYRLLDDLLDPEVGFQLDVYWARTAGADPAQILDELGPRVVSLHLKDGPAVHGRPMTALGEGVLDFPAILRAVRRPLDLVVELDECATDPMEAAARSYRYLQRLLPGS